MSPFDYSIIPHHDWPMATVRTGLQCDKPTFHRLGVTLKTMLLARGLMPVSMRTRKNRTDLNEGIDEFMKQAEFQILFQNIPRSWLKPALTAYAKRLNYNNIRKRRRSSSPPGKNNNRPDSLLSLNIQ